MSLFQFHLFMLIFCSPSFLLSPYGNPMERESPKSFLFSPTWHNLRSLTIAKIHRQHSINPHKVKPFRIPEIIKGFYLSEEIM